MYVHPAFQTDRTNALRFAAARGFGLVAACDAGRPVGAHLPFHLSYAPDGTPIAEFHVARANPLAALAEHGGTWLLTAVGPDAYVSPEWYASPDQVPTWLYESVHLSGAVSVMSPTRLAVHLHRLSATFETAQAPEAAWTPDKVTPGRYKMLSKAIVGIEMEVETVEGNFKLNQHKSDADHLAVVQALRGQGDPGAQHVAACMIALRSHLEYEAAAMAPSAALQGAL